MAGWVTDQWRSGRMMGSMMWGNPERLTSTCVRWMAASPAFAGSTGDASSWCQQMVGWMTDHRGDWTGWGSGWMNGPMMGR
jgi:hypothetical protein